MEICPYLFRLFKGFPKFISSIAFSISCVAMETWDRDKLCWLSRGVGACCRSLSGTVEPEPNIPTPVEPEPNSPTPLVWTAVCESEKWNQQTYWKWNMNWYSLNDNYQLISKLHIYWMVNPNQIIYYIWTVQILWTEQDRFVQYQVSSSTKCRQPYTTYGWKALLLIWSNCFHQLFFLLIGQ